jgi:hypothetical protein
MNYPYQIETPHQFNSGAEQIRTLIQSMEHTIQVLVDEISLSETRAGVNDRTHVAYPFLARALLERQHNLKESIATLKRRLPDVDTSAFPSERSLQTAS